MQNKEQIIEDEIDLRELFRAIWDKKIFILLFTTIVTFISVIYVYSKNPIPLYQGKIYIEIGQIQSQNFGQISLDSASDLAGILNLEFKVNANIFKSTTKILEISITNEDKNLIKQNLEKSVEFIINKHKEKAKFYENVIMTRQVGDIEIGKNPINMPKKKPIVVVTFVSGIILSIFIIFFVYFINSIRRKEDFLVSETPNYKEQAST